MICPNCNGNQVVDSGGVEPWGGAIFIMCGFCDGMGDIMPEVKPTVVPSIEEVVQAILARSKGVGTWQSPNVPHKMVAITDTELEVMTLAVNNGLLLEYRNRVYIDYLEGYPRLSCTPHEVNEPVAASELVPIFNDTLRGAMERDRAVRKMARAILETFKDMSNKCLVVSQIFADIEASNTVEETCRVGR